MKTILYLTDLYYQAKGRKYYEEDLYITSKLKDHFHLLIGHPQQVLSYPTVADLVVFRNTGPVIGYQDYFHRFVKLVNEKKIPTFNSFDGKADRKGKQYLPDLFAQGYPVIPTIEKVEDLHLLGEADRFVIKLKNGADSIGMEILRQDDLLKEPPTGKLIQPFLDFAYEVSFYYLDGVFQYALYSPDKTKRWALKDYQATAEDLHFSETFLRWNNMARGIVRVDACRLKDGTLQLVELEDLNPFLSLDQLPPLKRDEFIANLVAALQKAC